MNYDLIDKLKKGNLKSTDNKENLLQELFKPVTSELIRLYDELNKVNEEEANRMLSYVLVGVLLMSTKTIDESMSKLNKIKEESYKLICEADKIINIEDEKK